MSTNLISIIIPVYNVSSYLAQCLESVLEQTYRNLQIICVDDGSIDGSGEICDSYAKRDSRLQVIHQKNAGAGAARNVGLSVAEGEFVGFVDSDDYIAPEMYQSLLDVLMQTDSDIAACEMIEVYKNRMVGNDASDEIQFFSGVEFLKKTAEHWKYYNMVNKLFRRELVEGICFPEGNIIDDGFYTYEIIARAKKVAWIQRGLYCYRQRRSSVMNEGANEAQREREIMQLQRVRLDFVKIRYPEISRAFQVKMINNYIENICNERLGEKEMNESLQYMRHNCSRVLFKEYSVKESIWILLFMAFPRSMKKRRKRYSVEKRSEFEDTLFD